MAQPDHTKALDALRHRLQLLTNDLYTLLGQLHQQPPKSQQQEQSQQQDQQAATAATAASAAYLLPWPELQSSVLRTSSAVNDVLSTLSSNAAFLSSAHVYPLPGFPGRSQEAGEGMLRELLRKRLEPGSEDWVLKGQEADAELVAGKGNTGAGAGAGAGAELGAEGMGEKEFEQLWDWAGPAENDLARKLLVGVLIFEDDDNEDDDEDEDDGDKMDVDGAAKKDDKAAAGKKQVDVKPQLPLEDVLRYMYTGNARAGPMPGIAAAGGIRR